MSNSVKYAECPLGKSLGKYCPNRVPDPAAHPPPEKWQQDIDSLRTTAASDGYRVEDGATAAGLFLSFSDGQSYVIFEEG